jgi:hypothetical protein
LLTRALLVVVALGGAAYAQTPRVVALAPLSTLGTEDTSASSRKITQQLEAAFAALPNTKVITAAQVAQAIAKAKKSQLKACDREAACLAELGKLVGATYVIDGEIGGLNESKVVYLGATDVASAKELRSTTLQVGAKADTGGGAGGAAVRLLEPDRYRGTIRFIVDVKGATVYVNGSKAALSPKGELGMGVGTQAVRVTHPEYRDFVRFVDVPYASTVDVPVNMTQYARIDHDIQGKPVNTDQVVYIDPPWWRRPYVYGPAAVLLAVGVGVLVGAIVHDFPDGECRKVGGAACD